MDNQTQSNIPSFQPQTQTPISPSTNWGKVFLFVLLGLIFTVGVVFAGIQIGKNKTPNQQLVVEELTITPTQIVVSPTELPITNPSRSPIISPFGLSEISFTDSGGVIYLKHTVTLTDNKVEFPNNKIRTMTKVYSQDDKSFEPQELINIDSTKYSWTELILEGINDSVDSKSILVSDRLLSFKKIPNTNSFIFVAEWSRSAGQNLGSWSPYQSERVLFYYDRKQSIGKLNKIETFPDESKKYTYPKIGTFSQDGRYISLDLFGCWNCGGHMPETFLLDTHTLKTKNIGKAVKFAWKQNGAYEYKDYIVIECKEPQPGECTQDPNTLPLKIGQF